MCVTKDRLKVVLWYDSGWTHQQIADALFININTSVKHLDEYLTTLKVNKNSGGKESKLNPKQTEEFINFLSYNLCSKVQEVIAVCQSMFGVKYKKTGMIDWLRRHHFSYKKPPKSLPNCDVEAQINFIEKYDLLKDKINLSEGKEVLVHMDAVYPTMKAKLSYGWINSKAPIKIITKNNSTRVNIAGATKPPHS